jgi:cytochrome c biogenesis protein CcmG/thiol:disulfide interchange protein DsbE
MTHAAERPVSGSNDSTPRWQRARGWSYLPFGLTLLAVAAVLGLLGARLVAGGWSQPFGDAAGIVNSGRPVPVRPRPAPDFQLVGYAGEPVRLGDLRGRPVVITFWASWCPPCRTEAPLLERAWQTHRAEGLVVVGINVWDSAPAARAFIDELGLTYPTAADPNGAVAIDYGLAGVPETVFIDRQGRIVGRWAGPVTEAALRRFLDEFMLAEAGR